MCSGRLQRPHVYKWCLKLSLHNSSESSEPSRAITWQRQSLFIFPACTVTDRKSASPPLWSASWFSLASGCEDFWHRPEPNRTLKWTLPPADSLVDQVLLLEQLVDLSGGLWTLKFLAVEHFLLQHRDGLQKATIRHFWPTTMEIHEPPIVTSWGALVGKKPRFHQVFINTSSDVGFCRCYWSGLAR